MKARVSVATFVLAMAAVAGSAAAQESSNSFFKPPTFLLMPGGLTSCSISCDAGKSQTKFNARFQTVLPTRSQYLAFVGGLQWDWADSSGHGPIGFFGAILPLVPINNATNGWLSFSVDPLGVTTAAGSKGTNFVMEGAVVANIGAKMMATTPVFRGFGAYFLVDQQITRLPKDANGNTDRWNPALVWGGFIPLAP